MGPRVPGSDPHARLGRLLSSKLEEAAEEAHVQEFTVSYGGKSVACANRVGFFPATRTPVSPGAILLGTHFDTRPRADREEDAARRELPIPGANDGGSGTAILLHMLPALRSRPRDRDLIVVFFDAEDLGDIDGNPFSLGAECFAANPCRGLPEISEAVVLDMVGGEGMVLDFDANSLGHGPSRKLTSAIFAIGGDLGAAPFTRDKPARLKYIVSDHWPFLVRGIPSCILIDIDYPQWHTHGDLPEAMSERSLEITEEALWLFLSRSRD
jgi:Zn-dependent M28 family amino/carboxypeptidase